VLDLLENMGVSPESERLRGYISNNLNTIDYPEYLRNGYFIGSGGVESGNKTVLQNRLKQAGTRWNSVTAQYLLTLKSKYESDLWNAAVVFPIIRHYSAASLHGPAEGERRC
jgi:hypothetical protein